MKTDLTKDEENQVDNLIEQLLKPTREKRTMISSSEVNQYRDKLRVLENLVEVESQYFSKSGASAIGGLTKRERSERMLENQRWVRKLPNSYMLAACGFTWGVRINMWWKDITWPFRKALIKRIAGKTNG